MDKPLEEMDRAITAYKNGYLTAKEALRIYFRLAIAEEWAGRLFDPAEIRGIFRRRDGQPMTKPTFWRVVSQLLEEGEIDFDESEVFIKRLKSGRS